MNKTELIADVAEKTDIPKATIARVLEAVLDSTGSALKLGDSVTLVGFGTFYVSTRAARSGRNPRNGEEIRIAAAQVPRFRAGKGLKDAVN
ncbi:DNA-binding protein HU-beta [Betaproteobacteria bacterium]|nr:DNA-binding protein HU-beta [Betaproteobacteria bacterium]GHT98099.1 DNA-binding protein HU-beta [Betaproteobacteria bacterium]GHU08651.1 DNA-binding protein HU-beta [Betaproteobacteria bacterium]GHU18828.1 DNA-binding protein HU-beta [Betaproteobacteria bacterium]